MVDSATSEIPKPGDLDTPCRSEAHVSAGVRQLGPCENRDVLARLGALVVVRVDEHVRDERVEQGACALDDPVGRLRRDAGGVRDAADALDLALVDRDDGLEGAHSRAAEEDLAAAFRGCAALLDLVAFVTDTMRREWG